MHKEVKDNSRYFTPFTTKAPKDKKPHLDQNHRKTHLNDISLVSR